MVLERRDISVTFGDDRLLLSSYGILKATIPLLRVNIACKTSATSPIMKSGSLGMVFTIISLKFYLFCKIMLTLFTLLEVALSSTYQLASIIFSRFSKVFLLKIEFYSSVKKQPVRSSFLVVFSFKSTQGEFVNLFC